MIQQKWTRVRSHKVSGLLLSVRCVGEDCRVIATTVVFIGRLAEESWPITQRRLPYSQQAVVMPQVQPNDSLEPLLSSIKEMVHNIAHMKEGSRKVSYYYWCVAFARQ